MPYGEFEAMAIQKGFELFEMSIDEIEEAHWAKICTEKKYAISNNLSLFDDRVKLWNLNSFTKAESNIHWARPHYYQDNVIEGIQSPNIYVGSPLTSFGYHIEDGHLNSINYLHHGGQWFLS